MTIVEYDLVDNATPSYITDGGYWYNPANEKVIGVGLEGSIPDDATTLTLAELQVRERAIHANYPRVKAFPLDPDELTNDEVNAAVKAWVDAR